MMSNSTLKTSTLQLSQYKHSRSTMEKSEMKRRLVVAVVALLSVAASSISFMAAGCKS